MASNPCPGRAGLHLMEVKSLNGDTATVGEMSVLHMSSLVHFEHYCHASQVDKCLRRRDHPRFDRISPPCRGIVMKDAANWLLVVRRPQQC
jgi:hypothetical protein